MNKKQQNSTLETNIGETIDGIIGLTPSQEKCALMLASGSSITDTAKELGIDRTTIYLWLKKIAFTCYLNKIKKDIQEHMNGCLFEMHSLAISALQDSLNSTNEAIRLKASMWVFEKISSFNIGASDAREVLKKECTHSAWGDMVENILNEKEYNKRLVDEGFDKI